MKCPYCSSENVHNAENHWEIKPYQEVHKNYKKFYKEPKGFDHVTKRDLIVAALLVSLMFNIVLVPFFVAIIWVVSMPTMFAVVRHNKRWDAWKRKKICENCCKVFKRDDHFEPVAL